MKKLLTTLSLILVAVILLPLDKAGAQTSALTSPSDGSEFTVNSTNSVTLYYAYTGGLPFGVFEVQVDNNSDFSSPVISTTTTNTSYSFKGGENGVTYYWRVRASYYLGQWIFGPWTSSRTFGFFIPRLQSPSNGSTNRTLPITLSWMKVVYSSSLKLTKAQILQIDNNSDFSSPEVNISNRDDSYTTSALKYDTKYYWRVRYYTSLGLITNYHAWSSVYSFTTGCDAGIPPTLSSPANGASGLTQPITLDWAAVTNADNYSIQISKNTSFSPTVVNNSTGNVTNYEASGLENGTTYYWRVGSHECAWGSYSGYRSFTTACPLPAPPGLTSPSDGATGLSMPFYLDWNAVADADQYRVQVDDNSNFSSPIIVEQPASSQYQVVSGLTPGVVYFWRVQTHTDCGWGVYGASRSFTLVCPTPDKPTLELPPNGVADISQPVTLDWADVAGASKYHLQVDDDPAFGSLLVNASAILSSSYPASGMDNSLQYYWRVRAGNDCGSWSAWSDVRNFTTDCPVLGPPALSLPANDETDLDVRNDVALDWTGIKGATGYVLEVANNDQFTFPFINQEVAETGYLIKNPLTAGTWYYWRVRTMNACGSGDWSNAWKFQPYCPAAGVPTLLSPPNGSLNIEQPIDIDWDAVAEATKYHLQVDDDMAFGSIDIDQEYDTAPVSLPDLLEGISHYWRVRAYNGCQWGEWSNTWNFVPGVPSDVEIVASDEIPESFILKQNYPNPFNPATTIEFALPKAAYVTLDILNILGEKVETIVSQPMSAGSYSVIWDASDVPSGVYFYKIEADSFSESKKMTLIK